MFFYLRKKLFVNQFAFRFDLVFILWLLHVYQWDEQENKYFRVYDIHIYQSQWYLEWYTCEPSVLVPNFLNQTHWKCEMNATKLNRLMDYMHSTDVELKSIRSHTCKSIKGQWSVAWWFRWWKIYYTQVSEIPSAKNLLFELHRNHVFAKWIYTKTKLSYSKTPKCLKLMSET